MTRKRTSERKQLLATSPAQQPESTEYSYQFTKLADWMKAQLILAFFALAICAQAGGSGGGGTPVSLLKSSNFYVTDQLFEGTQKPRVNPTSTGMARWK